MATDVKEQESANTSRDSKESGGQKSMLELLSITDAAVKALNKSVRSTSSAGSHDSKKSHRSDLGTADPLIQSIHSDRSVKSSQSGHSMKSAQSGHSEHSKKSGHSHHSHDSTRSAYSQGENLSSRVSKQQQDVSRDSGVISKTHTLSEPKAKAKEVSPTVSPEGASDVSTTASDVLIHSTHERSTVNIVGENGILENVSTTSKCSKTSFGVENFNSSGPQKVKISKRRLKEIKDPFEEDALRDSASSDEKVPLSLLSEDGKPKRGSRTISERSSESRSGKSETGSHYSENGKNSDTNKCPVIKGANGHNGAKRNGNFPQGVESGQINVEKVRKSTEKDYDDINISKKNRNNGTLTQQPANGKERQKIHVPESSKLTNGAVTKEPEVSVGVNHFRSTPKYFVERHTPQKAQTKLTDTENKTDSIPERKNLLKDLEDSVEIITAGAKDSSGSSSQPDIITVPERIVTVTAKDLGSPASTVSVGMEGTKISPPLVSYHSAGHKLRDDKGSMEEEKQKSLDDSNIIPPALPAQFKKADDCEIDNLANKFDGSKTISTRSQWFSKQATGHGLLQGAPVNGHDAPDKQKDEDVHISDFKLTEKQRMARENFARRQGGPIRRVVQPRLVGHDSKASSTSSAGEQKTHQQLGQSNDQVLTAAAAASAAVAATQPFLKAQYEMEARMAELVEKINELQKVSGVKAKTAVEEDRIAQLEKQLTDVTEKRIDYMEKLQEQQIAMQAKLLSLTRDARSQASRQVPPSPESHIYIHSDSRVPSATNQNKAFSKTTVHRPAPKGDYSERIQKYSSMDKDDSLSPLHTPAPRSRAPKPTVYDTSDLDLDYRSRSRKLSPKGRSPKARSPKGKSRARSKSPSKENHDQGILHQILASSHSPPVRDTGLHPQRPPVLQERNYRTADSPNVKKAKGLIEDLSSIKDQVKTLAEDKERWSQASHTEPQGKEPTTKDDTAHTSNINLSHTGPSPLDSYLKMPEKEPCSPYKTVPDLSFSHFNAPLLPGFRDAESILKQVQKNRGILESNLETVFKGRREVEVYNVLETLYNDSNNKELGHIQKMVDNAITKLRREVEREVTDDVVIAALKKKQQTSVPGAAKMPEPAPTKPAGRYGIRSRLQEQKKEPKVEPKKQPGKKPGTSVISRPQFRKPARSVFEDEAYMTQVYGKASYQKGRTTVKDPYLHFQNTAKPKPARPAAVKEVKATEVMSSKTQTAPPGVRQFYFNPNTGTYIPIASMPNTAPIPGQLIPMAVPLGGPRIDSGLAIPTESAGPVTFDQGQIPQVTAAGNVAMVSIGTDGVRDRNEHIPELGKQVLPAVDIDTDMSEMSEVVEERQSQQLSHMTPDKPKKSVQIISPKSSPDKTPGQGRFDVVYHEDSKPEMQTEEVKDEDSSNTNTHLSFTQSIQNHDHDQQLSDDTLVEDEDDVETATGMELPGYQPVEIPEAQYNGPVFPPKQPSTDRQLTSELIAEDIRRKDMLQNQANDWLEQELMARIITELYPLKDKEEPAELSHVVSEGSEDSMAEEKEQSMFIMDSIGHRGMQLFIDAGYPVDNNLVNKLVKEVLQEKIRTMLGQRPDSEDQTRMDQQRAEDQYDQDWEEPVSEDIDEPVQTAQQVRTPEPTPKTSPASSPPPRRATVPQTPPASPRVQPTSPRVQELIEPEVLLPPAQPVQPPQPLYEPESEPESSASYDIKEEINRLADQLRPHVDTSASFQSRHDVATPPESPKPEPQPIAMRPLTPPELTPRPIEEGFTISQKFMPAGMSAMPGKASPHVSKSDTPKSPTSAQISEEMPEEIMEDQPKPVMFTVAETQTEIAEEPRKARSPSPARERPLSRSPSESSITESSSISDTYNENISEGQWLINKSDGEMADFPVDPNVVRNRILRTSQKRVDVSSASTWKDADDIDLEEMTDASKSEGEFLYRTDMPPEKDPVLHLLARLQHDAPQYGLYNLSNKQVTDVLNNTGKSEGEVIRVAPSQQQYEQQQQMLYQQQQQQQSRPFYRQQRQQQQPPFQQQPQTIVIQSEPVRSKSPQARSGSSYPKRTQSPSFRMQSPTRVSFEDEYVDQRSISPTRGILKQTSSYDNQRRPQREEDFDRPVRDSGRSVTPTGRLTPGGRQPQAKGMISAGGRTSPMKSKSRSKPPQTIKSSTMPEARGSGPGSRLVNVRGSSEDYRDSLENTGGASYFGTGSDHGTRTMTPDQMNMDALIQSGYLSQSFSQSENGKQTGHSSVRSSGDLRLSRTSASGGSLGLTYGTDRSMTESELQRLATHGTGRLQMSLTIPGADRMDESDISELDNSAFAK